MFTRKIFGCFYFSLFFGILDFWPASTILKQIRGQKVEMAHLAVKKAWIVFPLLSSRFSSAHRLPTKNHVGWSSWSFFFHKIMDGWHQAEPLENERMTRFSLLLLPRKQKTPKGFVASAHYKKASKGQPTFGQWLEELKFALRLLTHSL